MRSHQLKLKDSWQRESEEEDIDFHQDAITADQTSDHLELLGQREVLTRMLDGLLNPRQRYIFLKRQLRGASQRELANELGISPERVRQIEGDIFYKFHPIVEADRKSTKREGRVAWFLEGKPISAKDI
jgi:RNA polymerase sigma factor (sigma-70 family)